jgi:predicted GNAT family N-acyltransferase
VAVTAGGWRVTAELAVRWASAEEELAGALALRELVFCGEQGVARAEELDGRDGAARHVVALAPDTREVVGTLRLLVDGGTAKVGRVAVARAWRRRGIASRMLQLAIAGARERGCHARALRLSWKRCSCIARRALRWSRTCSRKRASSTCGWA